MNRVNPIRILYVDDDPEFGELAAEFLLQKDDRFDVHIEHCGSDALQRFQEDQFDCIVSDYDMPGMDGLDFLRAVRDDDPDVPFILFTGKGSEDIASEAISAGVTDYLQKGGPERYTLLANRLRNAVERVRAKRRTELSHQAMETASEGLSLVEPDGTFSYVNPAFAALFGYEQDELIDQHWRILYHNEEADRLENHILPAVLDTGYWAGETVRLRKDGETVITDHRLAHTDEGVIVCTAQNITAERHSTTERTGTFDLLAETVGEYAFYALDHEGYITRWNEQAAALKGYQIEEALGKHVRIFFTDRARRRDTPTWLLEAARREGSISDEGWRLRKDGSQFWADVTIAANFDDSGTLRGFGKLVREAPDPQIPA